MSDLKTPDTYFSLTKVIISVPFQETYFIPLNVIIFHENKAKFIQVQVSSVSVGSTATDLTNLRLKIFEGRGMAQVAECLPSKHSPRIQVSGKHPPPTHTQ
jgi:hypothetical protein